MFAGYMFRYLQNLYLEYTLPGINVYAHVHEIVDIYFACVWCVMFVCVCLCVCVCVCVFECVHPSVSVWVCGVGVSILSRRFGDNVDNKSLLNIQTTRNASSSSS